VAPRADGAEPVPAQRQRHGGDRAVALGLVVMASRTGFQLVTQDLPSDMFTARWLAQIGVRRG
jgi:hypothetical protein